MPKRKFLYILYNSPADIFRNLFTEIYEHNNVIAMPKKNTAAAVIASSSHDIIIRMFGS